MTYYYIKVVLNLTFDFLQMRMMTPCSNGYRINWTRRSRAARPLRTTSPCPTVSGTASRWDSMPRSSRCTDCQVSWVKLDWIKLDIEIFPGNSFFFLVCIVKCEYMSLFWNPFTWILCPVLFYSLYVNVCEICLCLCNSVETPMYMVSILFVCPCRWFLRPVLCACVPGGEGPHYGGDAGGVRQGGEVCDPEARLWKLPVGSQVSRWPKGKRVLSFSFIELLR